MFVVTLQKEKVLRSHRTRKSSGTRLSVASKRGKRVSCQFPAMEPRWFPLLSLRMLRDRSENKIFVADACDYIFVEMIKVIYTSS